MEQESPYLGRYDGSCAVRVDAEGRIVRDESSHALTADKEMIMLNGTLVELTEDLRRSLPIDPNDPWAVVDGRTVLSEE